MSRGPFWELRKRSSSASVPNPTLVEVHEWVQPTHCTDGALRHGQLLRWMDIAACLSAEKHGKMPCVTVSIDDITFDTHVSVGHIVILSAVVNRAFTSSMEVGVSVQSEDPITGTKRQVCKAYSVFVAKPTDGGKAKLPPVIAMSEEDNKEYLLAAERRRMRITYAKDIAKAAVKSSHFDMEAPESPIPWKGKVRVSETQVHTVNIVLPVHANHHGTTFGGQIMEWMTDVATISAMRLCRCPVVLEGIESVHFRGPSHMGERVTLQSSVNKVFSNRKFEVGVRVEGFEVGGAKRHINSAFFLMRPDSETTPLPELVIDTGVEGERAANAIARHCLWLDRRAIRFEQRQVTLTSENVYDLILKNTAKLMTNFARKKWEVQRSSVGFELSKHESTDNLILRIQDQLHGFQAADVFSVLTDFDNRPKWDFICKHARVFQCITAEDSLLHLTFRSLSKDQLQKDFVLLCSQRAPQDTTGSPYFIVAYSSVHTPDLSELKGYERSRVISSGFVVEELGCDDNGDPSCEITYLHQLGSSVMPFFAKDVLGMSTLSERLYRSLRQYLSSRITTSSSSSSSSQGGGGGGGGGGAVNQVA